MDKGKVISSLSPFRFDWTECEMRCYYIERRDWERTLDAQHLSVGYKSTENANREFSCFFFKACCEEANAVDVASSWCPENAFRRLRTDSRVFFSFFLSLFFPLKQHLATVDELLLPILPQENSIFFFRFKRKHTVDVHNEVFIPRVPPTYSRGMTAGSARWRTK